MAFQSARQRQHPIARAEYPHRPATETRSDNPLSAAQPPVQHRPDQESHARLFRQSPGAAIGSSSVLDCQLRDDLGHRCRLVNDGTVPATLVRDVQLVVECAARLKERPRLNRTSALPRRWSRPVVSCIPSRLGIRSTCDRAAPGPSSRPVVDTSRSTLATAHRSNAAITWRLGIIEAGPSCPADLGE